MRDTAEIISILKEFYNISGFRVSIHDLECNEIYAYPPMLSDFCRKMQLSDGIKNKCLQTDRKAFERVRKSEDVYMYKCHCGLYEAVAPIYHFGILSGFLMMGQIRDTEPGTLEYIRKRLEEAVPDSGTAQKCAESVKAIESRLIPAYVDIMKMVAEHITATGKINYCGEDLAELIKKYINRNFSSKISLSALSEKFGCSSSTAMKHFKAEYGVTIADYINDVRLKSAEKMLSDSRIPVKQIAADCGFSDQNYFSRQFSRKYGISPTEYRNIVSASPKIRNQL